MAVTRATSDLIADMFAQSVRLVLAEMQDVQTRLAALDVVVRQVSLPLLAGRDTVLA